MKHINLSINLTDDLGIKSVTINFNDTGLPDNSELIKKVAFTLLESLCLNKDSLLVQDLLNELKIETSK